ncbi:hypothetical protein CRENPOLYSF1_1160001 [Crenothrix polyspora]|uniref:Uncharacterized protein n=1 Tax=Crenothrix polyspora TaxID=360316 RepID=A0A1R4H0B2_9GAMM|nr:hypothetical protein CRENPOLYSF1_1160001 [Crenothrix polyspora]
MASKGDSGPPCGVPTSLGLLWLNKFGQSYEFLLKFAFLFSTNLTAVCYLKLSKEDS